MRTLADEARTGTLDLLLAVPLAARAAGDRQVAGGVAHDHRRPRPGGSASPSSSACGATPIAGPIVSGFLGLALLAGGRGRGRVCSPSALHRVPAHRCHDGAVRLGGAVVRARRRRRRRFRGVLFERLSFSERLRLFAGGAIDTGRRDLLRRHHRRSTRRSRPPSSTSAACDELGPPRSCLDGRRPRSCSSSWWWSADGHRRLFDLTDGETRSPCRPRPRDVVAVARPRRGHHAVRPSVRPRPGRGDQPARPLPPPERPHRRARGRSRPGAG